MADLSLEARLHVQGFRRIAGVDEAGRGPLAGPVVVAAVVLPGIAESREQLAGHVDDSKRLTPEARERAYRLVRRAALAWAVAVMPPEEIDRVNILQATLAGMALAVARLKPQPEFVLVDGNRAPALPHPAEAVVRGDQQSLSIAAASVVAKVVRDRLMVAYGGRYPQWGFERHKGYGTAAHLEALRRHGRSPIHRRSFRCGLAAEDIGAAAAR